MNASKPCGPSGGPQAPSSKRRWPRLRVSYSPSPQPSPRGEGETFARALIIRPGLVVVCFGSESQRGGDCNRNVRIFYHRANALVGKGEALAPLPPRCRDRVHSLYLPACGFPAPGDPKNSAPCRGKQKLRSAWELCFQAEVH